jgi:HK97 family phage major capsid protein
VELREETQIISGNGTGQNISGMTKSGNYTAFTPSSGEQALDGVNRAKYKVIEADYMPTGILLNPTNWGAIERLKGSDNAYLVGNPFGTITPVLWGLPVVASNSMTAGKQLVADFATSYEYAERQSTVIDVGYVNEDFTKNLVTIRAEKRGALATIRPASAYYGDLTL